MKRIYTYILVFASVCYVQSSIAQTICDYNINISTQSSITSTSCDGALIASTVGGTPPFSYLWLGPLGDTVSTGPNAGSLCTGSYTLIVSDSLCETIIDADVGVGPQLGLVALTLLRDTVNCFGDNDGQLNVAVVGGQPPYVYNWSNGDTGSLVTNLAVDLYEVTVTDNNGTQAIAVSAVLSPPKLIGSLVVTNVSCHDKCDGDFVLSATGGSGGYWLNYQGFVRAFSGSIVGGGLCPDFYAITVGDKNNCTVPVQANVYAPDPVAASFNVTHSPTCTTCAASATMTLSGGTGNYQFLVGGTIYTYGGPVSASGLCAGTYPIIVADGNFCILSTAAYVDCFDKRSEELIDTKIITPNPAKDVIQLAADEVSVFDLSGKRLGEYTDVETISVLNIPNGLYIVKFMIDGYEYTEKLVVQH